MNPNVELVKALRAKAPKKNRANSLMSAAADAIEILDKQLADILDPNLQSMRLEDGKFDMALGGPIVQHVALMMTEWFRESGAKNYVEMTLHARTKPFERYQFYVQKQGEGAKTPHQLRVDAETVRDAALAALEPARMLANLAFNLSQRGELSLDIRRDLSECQRSFDEATRRIPRGLLPAGSPEVTRPESGTTAPVSLDVSALSRSPRG